MLIGIIDENQYKILNMEEFLTTFKNIDLIVSGNDLENFLVKVNDSPEPEVIFIKVKQSNYLGTEKISSIRQRFLQSLIIIITNDTSDSFILESFKAGANCYLIPPILTSMFRYPSEIIKETDFPFSKEFKNFLIPHTAENYLGLEKILTKREIEVVNYLLKGMAYKEIASNMKISFYTVNDHVKKIYAKLNINSKGELLSLFIS